MWIEAALKRAILLFQKYPLEVETVSYRKPSTLVQNLLSWYGTI